MLLVTFRKRLVSTAMLAEAAAAAGSASSRPSLQARTLLAPCPNRRRLWPVVVGPVCRAAGAGGLLPMLPGLLAVALGGGGGAVRCSTSGCPAASPGGQDALDFQCGLRDGNFRIWNTVKSVKQPVGCACTWFQ